MSKEEAVSAGATTGLLASLWPNAGKTKENARKKSREEFRMALGFDEVKISNNTGHLNSFV
jgi:hypothetical protein